MKFKQFIASIMIIICGLSLVSCDPSSEYVYIISNRSSETIHLLFYPQDWVEGALEAGKPYWNYNSVYLLGNGSEKIDYYRSPFELKPGESLKFSDIVELSAYVQKTPEHESRPLWLKDYYIDRILVGGDPDNAQKEIAEDYWSYRSNWSQQNKKKRYVEYWLIIDDDVVNNNYAPINNHR
ncbi:MAG: hypothetical protein K2M93_01910 [Muribaculaceae bacterium]|nr:hypothetical protein [Muribaculaceae bacterium]